METKQAIDILVQVAHLAQKGGLLQLADAVAVAKAINALAPKEEVIEEQKRITFGMKYINYFFASLILLFVPIYGLLIAVGSAIILDTFTGIFKSIKLNGLESIRSRKLSNVISKMALYEICIIFLFLIDKFVLNEFVKHAFGFDFMFTKICAILLIFVELVSIKENIEETFKIDIWQLLKKAFNRAKEIKADINEIKR